MYQLTNYQFSSSIIGRSSEAIVFTLLVARIVQLTEKNLEKNWSNCCLICKMLNFCLLFKQYIF